jgi:hypothetical protein
VSDATVETCVSGPNGCGVFRATACGGGTVCERTSPQRCLDPTWAEWPMPNDPADVAEGAPNPPSYTESADGVVTDNVTTLMWQQVYQPADTLGEAQDICQVLRLGGFSDWRVPSVIELLSLADYGRFDPSIDDATFPGTYFEHFWSFVARDGFPGSVYTVEYVRGLIFSDDQDGQDSGAHAVRCVR